MAENKHTVTEQTTKQDKAEPPEIENDSSKKLSAEAFDAKNRYVTKLREPGETAHGLPEIQLNGNLKITGVAKTNEKEQRGRPPRPEGKMRTETSEKTGELQEKTSGNASTALDRATRYGSPEWAQEILGGNYRERLNTDWVGRLVTEPFRERLGLILEDQKVKEITKLAERMNAKLSSKGYDMKIEVIPTEHYSPADQSGADFYFKLSLGGKEYFKGIDLKSEGRDTDRKIGVLKVSSNMRLGGLCEENATEIFKVWSAMAKSSMHGEPPEFNRLIRGVKDGNRQSYNTLLETEKLVNGYAKFLKNTGKDEFIEEGRRIEKGTPKSQGPLEWLNDRIKQLDSKVFNESKFAKSILANDAKFRGSNNRSESENCASDASLTRLQKRLADMERTNPTTEIRREFEAQNKESRTERADEGNGSSRLSRISRGAGIAVLWLTLSNIFLKSGEN